MKLSSPGRSTLLGSLSLSAGNTNNGTSRASMTTPTNIPLFSLSDTAPTSTQASTPKENEPILLPVAGDSRAARSGGQAGTGHVVVVSSVSGTLAAAISAPTQPTGMSLNSQVRNCVVA